MGNGSMRLFLGHGLLVFSAWALGCGSMACSGNECPACMKEKCADLFEFCEGDPDCTCMSDCMGKGGIPGIEACLESCGLSARPLGFVPLEVCVATACPDSEDECSTPDDYVPPDLTIECPGSNLGIGGGSLPDCSIDPDLRFDQDGEVLQLESADRSVCVRLERRDDGAGSLANTQWTLLDMRVGPLAEVALVDDPADLCWYSSHHNFSDWAHVWTGTRHFDLRLAEDGHGGPRKYELYAFEQGPIAPGSCAPLADGSNCIEGPIELFPVNP